MAVCNLSGSKQLNFLKSLPITEKERLNANSISKKVRKGAIIFSEAELLQSLFYIKDGACKFSIIDDKGKEIVTNLLGKGDLMGRRSLISKKGAMVTATAISDTTLCCIDNESLLKGFAKNNGFCIDALKGFVTDDEERYLKMGLYENRRGIKNRLAGLLLYLKDKFGAEHNGTLNIGLKREEIANLLGTSSEYVITLLTNFKKQGLIGLYGGKINIISEKALRNLL
jgi:CRP-like cAMP-binding protein